MAVPEGFEIIETTLDLTSPADLKRGMGTARIYLAVSRRRGKEPITALTIIFPADYRSKKHSVAMEVPYGFEAISGDLMEGTGYASALLCVARGTAAPLTELAVLHGGHPVPPGYHMHHQDVNLGNDKPVFICYKRDVPFGVTYTAPEDMLPITDIDIRDSDIAFWGTMHSR